MIKNNVIVYEIFKIRAHISAFRKISDLIFQIRAGLRDCGALGKVIWGGPPEEVVANHILSIYEQKLRT